LSPYPKLPMTLSHPLLSLPTIITTTYFPQNSMTVEQWIRQYKAGQ